MLAVVGLLASCKELAGLTNLITNCTFSLKSVENYTVAGFDTSGKNSLKDFNFLDAAKISQNLLSQKLPISMVVNVRVDNPGEEALLNQLQWIALLDGKEMVHGNVDKRIVIPAHGNGVIPLNVHVDLFKVLNDESGVKVLETALALIADEKPSEKVDLSFKVKPTFYIAGQAVQYPEFITINP